MTVGKLSHLVGAKRITRLLRSWRKGLAAAIVLLICQPFVFASDSGSKKGSGNDKSAEKSADKKPNISIAEILERLDKAEADADAAREAAAKASEHASDLEKRLDDMKGKLTEAEKELQQFKVGPAAAKNVIAKGSQDQNQDKDKDKNQNQNQDQNNQNADQDQTAQDEQPAQEEAPAETVESLSNRVQTLEESAEINKSRISELSQTRVETGERFNVRLFGTLLFNAYYNTAGTSDPPTGLYLLSDKDRSLDNGSNFGATIRQTILGFEFSAPPIKGWRLSGDLQLDFFGGNPPVYNGRAFSPLRLRIAHARVQKLDENGLPGRLAIVFGQDDPIISPLNPTSLAQVGFPALAESGNLWSWTPQAKGIYHLLMKEKERLTIEGGIMAPYNGQTNREFQFETRPDAGERGRFPAFEARLSYQRGNLESQTGGYLLFPDPQPLQIGIGGHYARQVGAPGRIINSVAVTGDYVVPINRFFTLSGELFWGRSLSGLGGGIVQGIIIPIYGRTTLGIRSRGGWSQLNFRPHSDVSINLAYGQDDPYNDDLRGARFDLAGATSRTNNRTVSANMLYRFRSNFIMSVEYRFMQTLFTESTTRHNNHINIGFGYLF